MVPWFLFAMYEKNGQPLEKYLRCVIAVRLTRPKVRTYKTDNLYAAAMRQMELNKEVLRIANQQQDRRRKAADV